MNTLRKSALVAFVTSVATLLIAEWMQVHDAIGSGNPSTKLWMIPSLVLISLLAAIMPAFYLALYRNQGTLCFSKFTRHVSLMTALIFGTMFPLYVWEWIESLVPFWTAMKALDWTAGAATVIAATKSPLTIRAFISLWSELGNAAYLLLLITFFRQENDEPFSESDTEASPLLRRATKLALIVWGVWVGFLLIRLALTPYTHSQLIDYAARLGRRPPQLAAMMWSTFRQFLSQACLLVAPYVVYNSWVRRDEPQGWLDAVYFANRPDPPAALPAESFNVE